MLVACLMLLAIDYAAGLLAMLDQRLGAFGIDYSRSRSLL